MKSEIRTYGNTKNGKVYAIQNDGNNSLETHLLAFGDQTVEIIIRPIYEKHSRQSEGYYRAVVLPIATQAINDSTGEDFTPAEIHELLKALYNNGESTSDLDTHLYLKFTDRVKRMIRDIFNVNVPDPDRIEKVKTLLKL